MTEPASVGVLITLRAKAGRATDLASLLLEAEARVLAEEEDCLFYRVGRDRSDTSVFRVFQIYRSMGAVNAHRQTAYARQLGASLGTLLAEPGTADFLDLLT